jgi:phenylpropionate dioxygenase-like ring-hydroxylating dioxygenase large terminal subunit
MTVTSAAAVRTAYPSRLPRGLAAREAAEDEPLLRWWHPVAWGGDVGEKPYPTVLLGRGLVIWRDANGTARCFRDLCQHRGTALSLGEVDQGRLVCPYHGWAYEPDGRCSLIPQLPKGQPIPGGARALAFRCEERHGLIWVCLAPMDLDPMADIPDFPEYQNSDFRHAEIPAYTWQTSAARMLENFTDIGHLAWLHDGLLGSKDDTVVPPHDVDVQGHELHYSLTMQVPNAAGVNDTGSDTGQMTNTWVLSLPFTIHLRSYYPETGRARVLFFAVQPRNDHEASGFCYQSRDFDLDGDDQAYIDFQEVLAEQDRPVVESQRPEELPLDLADELHLRFDRVAVAYRKTMRKFGLPQ